MWHSSFWSGSPSPWSSPHLPTPHNEFVHQVPVFFPPKHDAIIWEVPQVTEVWLELEISGADLRSVWEAVCDSGDHGDLRRDLPIFSLRMVLNGPKRIGLSALIVYIKNELTPGPSWVFTGPSYVMWELMGSHVGMMKVSSLRQEPDIMFCKSLLLIWWALV